MVYLSAAEIGEKYNDIVKDEIYDKNGTKFANKSELLNLKYAHPTQSTYCISIRLKEKKFLAS